MTLFDRFASMVPLQRISCSSHHSEFQATRVPHHHNSAGKHGPKAWRSIFIAPLNWKRSFSNRSSIIHMRLIRTPPKSVLSCFLLSPDSMVASVPWFHVNGVWTLWGRPVDMVCIHANRYVGTHTHIPWVQYTASFVIGNTEPSKYVPTQSKFRPVQFTFRAAI